MSNTEKNGANTEKKRSNKRTLVIILAAVLLIIGLIILCARCNGNDTPDPSDPTTSTTPSDSTNPPETDPPATEPPETDPPATEPPATEPPATEPPATEPPATEPPATEPPATEPPATEPPATEPPATEPPATEPPATEPPATEPPATEPPATEPEDPSDTARVDNEAELNDAIANPDITTIILDADIVLEESLVIDKDVTIDLNGKTLKAAKDTEYPDARIMSVSQGCDVTVKNGTIVDNASGLNGGREFIIVNKGADLTLENVKLAISISPYVYYNNTMNRWQSNSADHRIIFIGNGASANLINSDISVVAPKVQNVSNYIRYRFSVVGVHFAKSGSNSNLVMDGGSFSIQVTDPNASIGITDFTDTLYFVRSERDVDANATASNTVDLKGDAQISIGGPNIAGDLNSTNGIFVFGYGYTSGKTIGSGLKTITMSADTSFIIDGFSYNLKNATAHVWETEDKYGTFGTGKSQKEYYDVHELKYHFECSDKAFGCTHEADFTLAELEAYKNEWGTRKVDGFNLARCPKCKYGGLQLTDDPAVELPPVVEPPVPEEPEDTVDVGDASEFNAAINNPAVNTIVLNENITLDETLVIDRDLTIDLNDKTIKAPKDVEYPDAMILTVSEGCTLTLKDGAIADNATNVNGGMDFIRVSKDAVLNMDNVTVDITLTPYVFFNNTMNRWQTNSADHRIIVLSGGASVNLTDSNISVVSPQTQNHSNYVRYKFSIIGVHFAKSSSNSQFVMDGGSFSIQVTDPHATKSTEDYTDKLYFVKAERDVDANATASNTVALKGNAQIAIGGPDEAGKIQTTNGLFLFGYGYTSGKTIGSGLKTISVATGTTFTMDGFAYTVKSDAAWDAADKFGTFGTGKAQKESYNIEEIKYHFACTDKGYSCTHEADYTLAEVPAKCPVCGKGSLVIAKP